MSWQVLADRLLTELDQSRESLLKEELSIEKQLVKVKTRMYEAAQLKIQELEQKNKEMRKEIERWKKRAFKGARTDDFGNIY